MRRPVSISSSGNPRMCKMSLLGWVVGAALLDEWGRREEEEREKEELRRKNLENERRIRGLEILLGRIEVKNP